MLGRLLFPDPVIRAGARALLVRSWRAFWHATEHPKEAQLAQLLRILERAKDTAFGCEHRFEGVRTLSDYRARVPIRTYDAFEPYVNRMLEGESDVLVPGTPGFFARSSGTTGSPKYIPVTPAYLAEYRAGRRVWLRQVMQEFPGLVRGRILTVHSPRIDGATPGGTLYGSITVPLTGPRRSLLDAVPRSLFLLEDFTLKYYVLLRLAVQEHITLAAAVNPSTLVLLAKKLDDFAEAIAADLEAGTLRGCERLPEPISSKVRALLRKEPGIAARIRGSKARHGRVLPTDVWPDIQGLLCWKGGSAPFFLAQLDTWFPGRAVMDYGYLASEGGFSIPLSRDGAGGVVAVTGHVLEFAPEGALEGGRAEEVDTFLAGELEVGQRYRVIVTGSQGLYRYDINDVVECVGHYQRTAIIAFVHKGGNMISLTGEKIGESHVVEAAARASRRAKLPLLGFCVSAELGDPPRYLLGVELERQGEDLLEELRVLENLLVAFDASLSELNLEYAAKRASLRLGPPSLRLLVRGAFERERDRRVRDGAPDAHVKPPHLVRDPSLLERLGVIREVEVGRR